MSAFYRRLGIRLATFPRRRRCSNSTFRQFRPYFTCNGISSWNHQLPHDRRESHRSLRQDTFHNTKQFSSDTTGDQSRKFTHLETPTVQDARELFILMDSKPGCLLTTFLDENNPNGDSTGSLEKYNVDWTGHYRGFSSIVVRPQSTEEVARILRYCSERRIGVVPQGGNTGLVGGSIPISSQEIVLSLEKMNNIESDDSELTVAGSVLRAEAGCILQDLQDRAAKAKCLVPVDLGAKGTCQIGGNVSTNAGGVYYYRYGSLHANVLGLEVVTPKGEILNLGYDPMPHLKDNTGYDLKHLFIGGEGTLGVVTKVALRCQPLPISRGAIWLTCASLMDVVRILALARTKQLSEILAAFEFMDGEVLELVRNSHPSIRFPVDSSSSTDSASSKEQYSILIETHGCNYSHDMEKLESFLECLFEEGLVTDGAMAQNLGQIEDFWNVRELCNPASAATGFVYKYDVSLAASDFGSFIHDIKVLLEDISQSSSLDKNFICVNWGHIIDGNLHCNIVCPGVFERDAELSKLIDESILKEVMKRNGSISAEHGLGQYKHKYLPQIKDQHTLKTMYNIKNLFDPHQIMNPGKYLPH